MQRKIKTKYKLKKNIINKNKLYKKKVITVICHKNFI